MTNFTLPLVVDAVAKASLILAVTALAAVALRRASASARHFAWALGLLSALAAPALSIALPRWELPIVTIAAPTASAPEANRQIEPAAPEAIAPPRRVEKRLAAGPATVPTSVQTPVSGRSLPSWPTLAFVIWAAGAIVILARMLLGLVAVQWMSRRTPEVTAASWLPQAQFLAAGLGLSRVRFLRGAVGTMPMAWGIMRASVLVPGDAETWPAHRIRVVLLHELAHVKRRDCLTHLVAQLACAAYWFNPLVWMAVRRLRTERERACDDLVLAAGTRGSDYADQLLDIARVMQAGRFPAVFAGASLAMAQRSQLEGRLIAILDPNVPRRGLTRARAATAAAIFTVLIVAIASVQPWAEERPAVDAPIADEMLSARPAQAPQPAPRPIDPAPVPANADTRRNTEQQRNAPAVASATVAGVVEGVLGGVASGVAGAIAEAADEIEREIEKELDQDTDTKGRARDPRAVNALLEALKDTDKEVRETAMHALVQMRDPRMFDPLVAALRDASADVRHQAAFGLGQLRDARAISPLSAALKDASADVREQVVFALGQLRATGALDAIVVALRDTSPSVREQAAFALSQLRDKKATEPLISSLKDDSASVREQAAFALGQMRASGAVEALVIALKDANPSVREQAAFALGQIGDARAIDGLMTALKDANASVRQQAAFALGQIR